MLYSHNHKFLQLRVPKSASTSAFIYLHGNMNPSDKDIHPICYDSNNPGNGFKNFPKSVIDKYELNWMHLTVDQILENKMMTVEQVTEVEKVGIVRNTLDRVLSMFFWAYRDDPKKMKDIDFFRECFSNGHGFPEVLLGNNRFRQLDWMKVNGELQDNTTVWPLEKVHEGLDKFTDDFGLNRIVELPHKKFRIKPDAKKFLLENYFDTKTRQAVEDYYAEDVEMYNRLMHEKT